MNKSRSVMKKLLIMAVVVTSVAICSAANGYQKLQEHIKEENFAKFQEQWQASKNSLSKNDIGILRNEAQAALNKKNAASALEIIIQALSEPLIVPTEIVSTENESSGAPAAPPLSEQEVAAIGTPTYVPQKQQGSARSSSSSAPAKKAVGNLADEAVRRAQERQARMAAQSSSSSQAAPARELSEREQLERDIKKLEGISKRDVQEELKLKTMQRRLQLINKEASEDWD